MKAMIFAAGLGTRLKPLTDHMPKALVCVNKIPLLDHTINTLIKAGATEIVINVHHFADQIKSHIHTVQSSVPLIISDESASLLDTGGGLLKASHLFSRNSSPILIHNVDIFSNADLASLYAEHLRLGVDALLLVSKRESSRYLLFDDNMRLMGWTNVKTGEVRSPYPNLRIETLQRFAFSGIHVFSPNLFDKMYLCGEKFSIIDFYLSVCMNSDIRGFDSPTLRLLDVGKLDSLKLAEEWLSSRL